MIRIVVDDNIKNEFLRAQQPCEVVDAAGNKLGNFTPAYDYTCPFSEEELRQAELEEGGRSLKEILADLEGRK